MSSKSKKSAGLIVLFVFAMLVGFATCAFAGKGGKGQSNQPPEEQMFLLQTYANQHRPTTTSGNQ